MIHIGTIINSPATINIYQYLYSSWFYHTSVWHNSPQMAKIANFSHYYLDERKRKTRTSLLLCLHFRPLGVVVGVVVVGWTSGWFSSLLLTSALLIIIFITRPGSSCHICSQSCKLSCRDVVIHAHQTSILVSFICLTLRK